MLKVFFEINIVGFIIFIYEWLQKYLELLQFLLNYFILLLSI